MSPVRRWAVGSKIARAAGWQPHHRWFQNGGRSAMLGKPPGVFFQIHDADSDAAAAKEGSGAGETVSVARRLDPRSRCDRQAEFAEPRREFRVGGQVDHLDSQPPQECGQGNDVNRSAAAAGKRRHSSGSDVDQQATSVRRNRAHRRFKVAPAAAKD